MTEEIAELLGEVKKFVNKLDKPKLVKLCFICEKNKAKFAIKGDLKSVYCEDCANDAFGDTSYLEKI